MTFILRKKSFAALRSNAPAPIDTSNPPQLPSRDDVFGPAEPLSAASTTASSGHVSSSGNKMGKLFGWTKKSASSPRVPQLDGWAHCHHQPGASGTHSPPSPASPALLAAPAQLSNISLTGSPASSSSLARSPAASTAPGEDLTSLGLFPCPPSSHPSLGASRHAHHASTASDYTIPRQHPSSAFTSPLLATSASDPRTMSTFNSGSSFASTALFSDEWESSGSEATSQLASSPESGSGLAPRMWKVRADERVSQNGESPLRTELRRPSWNADESESSDDRVELGYLAHRNSTPIPSSFSLANLAEPTTPPRFKRFSTSTLKASPTSPPFDLQQERAKAARERRGESATDRTADDVEAADDEMSPPRLGRQEVGRLQQQLRNRHSASGFLFASDVPYASSRIPSIRFEGISMDAVFAEVEKKMQSDEARKDVLASAADKKARRRSRVLSQYKPLEYGSFTTSPPAHQGSFSSAGSVPSLAASGSTSTSLSTMASLSSTDSIGSFDRSATPTPTTTEASRPRPYPRRTSSRRPAPLDVVAANSLPSAEAVSPNATPTNFASAVTPLSVSSGCIPPLVTVPATAAEPVAAADAAGPVTIPEFSFSPPSPALEGKQDWTGVPPSPTVEHGPEPAPVMVAAGILSEEPLAFKTVDAAPVVTKVTVIRPRPNIRISTRPAVKAPVRKRSTPSSGSPPTPPFSSPTFASPSSRAGPGSPATPTNRAFSFPPAPVHAHQRAMSSASDVSEADDAIDAMLATLNRPHTPPDCNTTPRAAEVATFGSPLTSHALEWHTTGATPAPAVEAAEVGAAVAYAGGWESGQESDDSDARFGDAPVQRRSRLMGPGVQFVGRMGMGPVVQIQPPSEAGSDRESSRHGRNYSGESFGAMEEEEEGDEDWEDESDSLDGHRLGLDELEDEIEAQLASMAGPHSRASSFGSLASDLSLSSEEEGVVAHVVTKTTGLGIGFGGGLPESDSCRSLASLASAYSDDPDTPASLSYLLASPESSPDRAPSLHRQMSPLPRNYSPFGLTHSPSDDSLAGIAFPSPPRASAKRAGGGANCKQAAAQLVFGAPPVFTISSPPRRRAGNHAHSSSSSSSASVSSVASSEGGYESMGEAVVMTGQRVSYANYEVGVAM